MPQTALVPRPGTGHRLRLVGVALAVLAVSVLTWMRPASSATAVPNRIDLRVLVLDDNLPWTQGLETQMDLEGIQYTAIDVSGATSRPTIDAAFLANGTEAKYQ